MVKGLLILISSQAGTGVSVLMSSHRRVDNPSNNRIIIIIKRATVTFIEQLMYTRLRSTWHWILTASCEEDSVNPLGNEVLKKLSDLSNVTQLMTARIWTQTAEFLTVLFCIFLKTFSKKEVRSFFHISVTSFSYDLLLIGCLFPTHSSRQERLRHPGLTPCLYLLPESQSSTRAHS